MKKFLASLLALVLLIGLIPGGAQAQAGPEIRDIGARLGPAKDLEGGQVLDLVFTLDGGGQALKGGGDLLIDLPQGMVLYQAKEGDRVLDLVLADKVLASALYEGGHLRLVLGQDLGAFSQARLGLSLKLAKGQVPKVPKNQEGSFLIKDLDKLQGLKAGDAYKFQDPASKENRKVTKLADDYKLGFEVKDKKASLRAEDLILLDSKSTQLVGQAGPGQAKEDPAPGQETPGPEKKDPGKEGPAQQPAPNANESLTSIRGQVKWVNDKLEDRPKDLEVRLIEEGTQEEVAKAKVSSENSWSYAFDDLVIKDKEGKSRTYKIEAPSLKGYSLTYESFNTVYTKEALQKIHVDIKGEILWKNDTASDRPKSVTVRLVDKETGKEVAKKEVTGQDGWKYAFTQVLESEGDKKFTYRVEQVEAPKGYKVSSSGAYDLVNTKDQAPAKKTSSSSSSTPSSRSSSSSSFNRTSSSSSSSGTNPKTLVEGYGLVIAGLALSGGALVALERKRRRD